MALLLNLVGKFKKNVENKKTEQVTRLEKAESWKKIADIFNSSSPSGVFRTVELLKKHYENKKSQVKKGVVEEKINILKTGGGRYTPKQDPLRDTTLSIMNEKTVYGLSNQFDVTDLEPKKAMVMARLSLFYIYEKEMDENTVKEGLEVEESELEVESNGIASWKKYTLEALKLPLDNALSKKINSYKSKPSGKSEGKLLEKPKELEETEVTPQRRRPVTGVLQGLQSSHLANQYSELAKVKLEIAKTQLETLKAEQASKAIETELRQKLLKVDLEIKERELQRLRSLC